MARTTSASLRSSRCRRWRQALGRPPTASAFGHDSRRIAGRRGTVAVRLLPQQGRPVGHDRQRNSSHGRCFACLRRRGDDEPLSIGMHVVDVGTGRRDASLRRWQRERRQGLRGVQRAQRAGHRLMVAQRRPGRRPFPSLSSRTQALRRVCAACHKSHCIWRFIQSSGDVPSRADSRHAVSAVTPRFPFTIPFRRFVRHLHACRRFSLAQAEGFEELLEELQV